MKTIHADATKERLIGEIDAVVDQTEQLLKTVAHAGNAEAGAFKATDDYVHGNPWRAVGIVAAAAGIIGLLAGLVLSRR